MNKQERIAKDFDQIVENLNNLPCKSPITVSTMKAFKLAARLVRKESLHEYDTGWLTILGIKNND